jgi:hypothetical protein
MAREYDLKIVKGQEGTGNAKDWVKTGSTWTMVQGTIVLNYLDTRGRRRERV